MDRNEFDIELLQRIKELCEHEERAAKALEKLAKILDDINQHGIIAYPEA